MSSTIPSEAMQVGELAKRTGLSVRTLHYYDEIGLLSPSQRTPAEYRLYIAEDVMRLQQIMSLRQLGFSLTEIRDCLERPDFSLQQVVQLHAERLREQIEQSQRLLQRLETLASHPTVTVDNLIQTIEGITMLEKYYTPEQLNTLQQRREQLGNDRIRQGEADWQRLIAAVKAEMNRGTDPASETVQALARQWLGLIQEFTGRDPGIEQSLNRMYQQEGSTAASQGTVDAAVFDYMGRAIAIAQAPE